MTLAAKKKKLKILVVAPVPFFDDRGTPMRVREEVEHLQKFGHHVDVVSYHLGRSLKGIKIYRIPWLGGKRYKVGFSWRKPFWDMFLAFKTLQLYLRHNYDVVHGFMHEGVFCTIIPRLLGAKVTFDAEGSMSAEVAMGKNLKKNNLFIKLLDLFERALNRVPHQIITSSALNAKELQKKHGVAKRRIHWIRDGVDINKFSPVKNKKEKEHLRKQFNIPVNKKIVLFVGLFTETQGFKYMMKAIPEILKKKDCFFVMIGYPDEKQYERELERKGLGDKVLFLGKVDYDVLPNIVKACDIGVSPKIIKTGEGNGKLYNFISCALATITTQNSVNKDICRDAAIYVPERNHKAIVKGIISLLKNEKKVHTLGKKGREIAVKMHSWEKVSREIEKVFLGLCD